VLRSSRKSNFLNSRERTRVLETAAATPILISRLTRMSFWSGIGVAQGKFSMKPLSGMCAGSWVHPAASGIHFRRSLRERLLDQFLTGEASLGHVAAASTFSSVG